MTLGEGHPKPLGLVWASCASPLPGPRLLGALEREADVHAGRAPPEGKVPSLVLACAEGEEDATNEVGRVLWLAPGAAVVVLGPRNDVRLARSALRAGARGFLHASTRPSEVARAVAVALGDETVVPRELVAGLIKGEEPADLSALTDRQREILALVAEGLANARIAKCLFVAESTVKQHLKAAYKHLRVKNRAQAARLFEASPEGGGRRSHGPPNRAPRYGRVARCAERTGIRSLRWFGMRGGAPVRRRERPGAGHPLPHAVFRRRSRTDAPGQHTSGFGARAGRIGN